MTGRVLRSSSFFVEFPAKTEQSGAAAAILDGTPIKNVLVGQGFLFQHHIGFTSGVTGFMNIGIK